MRAVVDVNVLISALLTRQGNPAWVMQAGLEGACELVVSPLLLDELERTLAYPKIRRRITSEEAAEFVGLLRRETLASDPVDPPPHHSPDPGDNYLVSLAATTAAVLVSGDRHLLGMADVIPVLTPPSPERGWRNQKADLRLGHRTEIPTAIGRCPLTSRVIPPAWTNLMDSAVAGWCGGGG